MYKTLSPDGVLDDRARLLFKDGVLNCGRGGMQTSITDSSMLPVTLSTVATDMGFNFSSNQYIAIGSRVKKAYMEKYGVEPHEQLCGASRVQLHAEGRWFNSARAARVCTDVVIFMRNCKTVSNLQNL